MTPGPPVLLLPPPGPLVWLHPELAEVEAELRSRARESAPGAVLDLALAELPDAPPAASLVLPGDALGRAAAPVLRARWPGVALAFGPGLGFEELAAGPPSASPVPLLPIAGGPGVDRRLDALLEETELAKLRVRRPVPVFLPAARRGRGAKGEPAEPEGEPSTRLAPAWWGLLPGEHLPAPRRDRVRRLIRALHPERYLPFLELENAALAGVDLYAHALLGRGARLVAEEEAPRTARGARPWTFAISGIDGAGKSTHVAALAAHLAARGLRTETLKMYRHGLFHDTVTDLNRRSAGGRALDLWRVQRLIKGFDSVRYLEAVVRPALELCDAVVFDRWTDTHLAAGAGRILHDPWTREMLSGYPPLDHLFLLDLPAKIAVDRLGAREERTIDENPYMLARCAKGLRDRALRERARHGAATILDATASFDENAALVREKVDEALARETE